MVRESSVLMYFVMHASGYTVLELYKVINDTRKPRVSCLFFKKHDTYTKFLTIHENTYTVFEITDIVYSILQNFLQNFPYIYIFTSIAEIY